MHEKVKSQTAGVVLNKLIGIDQENKLYELLIIPLAHVAGTTNFKQYNYVKPVYWESFL